MNRLLSPAVRYGAGALLLLAAPLLLSRDYWQHLAILSLLYALAALGYGVVLGYGGQLSLGHVGFFGAGAYVSMILQLRMHWPYWATLPAALLLVALLALIVGYPALRLRGPYFAAATLGFAEIMRLIALNWTSVTNGQLGLFLPTKLRPPHTALHLAGVSLGPLWQEYYTTMLLTAAGVALVALLISTRTGRAIVAVRENERVAGSLGVNPVRYKLLAFLVGALLCGAAGSYYGRYVGLVDPRLFSAQQTVLLLMMTVIGGARTIAGPLFGAFLLTLLPELLRINEALRPIIYGLFIILTINLMPDGLLGSIRRSGGRRTQPPEAAAGPPPQRGETA